MKILNSDITKEVILILSNCICCKRIWLRRQIGCSKKALKQVLNNLLSLGLIDNFEDTYGLKK
jgi:DNA-binding HxlR family transcriptional regulator